MAHHCAADGVVSAETRLDIIEAIARGRIFHGGVVEDISRHAGRGAGRAGGWGRAVRLLDHTWGGHHGRRDGREEEDREAHRHGADGQESLRYLKFGSWFWGRRVETFLALPNLCSQERL